MKKHGWTISREEGIIIAVLLFVFALSSDSIMIKHWIETGFDMSSYSPYAPFIGLASSWLMFLVLMSNKHIGMITGGLLAIGMVYSVIQIYGVFHTYTTMYDTLKLILEVLIIFLVVMTWAITKD